MSFQSLVQSATQYFPDLQIKYKDQSWFMKLLGTIMFFNKSFMDSYTTTVGSTVYFPAETYTRLRPVSAMIVLLHELVHINDAKKLSKPLFGALYLSPQILAILCLPLFLVSWKIALPLLLLFASPIPSYFRMHFEKRAYLTSMYALYTLSKKLNFDPKLEDSKQGYLAHFKNATYYFMWPFSNLDKDFDDALVKITAGQRPYEDPVFDILDQLMLAQT